jgi:hypothetical protein
MSFWEALLRPLRIKWVNLALRFVCTQKIYVLWGEKGGAGLRLVVLVVNEVIRAMSHAFSHVPL